MAARTDNSPLWRSSVLLRPTPQRGLQCSGQAWPARGTTVTASLQIAGRSSGRPSSHAPFLRPVPWVPWCVLSPCTPDTPCPPCRLPATNTISRTTTMQALHTSKSNALGPSFVVTATPTPALSTLEPTRTRYAHTPGCSYSEGGVHLWVKGNDLAGLRDATLQIGKEHVQSDEPRPCPLVNEEPEGPGLAARAMVPEP